MDRKNDKESEKFKRKINLYRKCIAIGLKLPIGYSGSGRFLIDFEGLHIRELIGKQGEIMCWVKGAR